MSKYADDIYTIMTAIVPITELRNTSKILEMSEKEPVFITKNGFGSRVLINIETYDKIKDILLDIELAEAFRRSEEEGGNVDAFEFLKELRDAPIFR
jgi:PHD/YefM family antitoxin component YafN of YafNO toxin-antitoxin module